DFQSSSIDLFQMDNSQIINFMHGTPKKFVGTNDTFGDFYAGTLYYGHTDEIICTSCVFTGAFGNYGYSIDTSDFSMQNGTIVVPNTAGSQVWAIPGTFNFFSGSS